MDESAPQTSMEAQRGLRFPNFRLSLSTAILISMVLGIIVGIFFGEMVGWLDIIGNAFIGLLQMTILPYILASLILGIGQLTLEKAALLAKKASLLLLLTWVIAFTFIMLMPFGFPQWESASFYSNSLVEFPPPPDFLALYIPSNPFHSMAQNLIPAVVIFAIAVGVALIGIPNKGNFLDDLRVLCEALMKVAGLVVKLTPIGVFAIAASAAGTMSVGELSKLQVYLIIFNVACLILAFWVLPMLVAAATPFRYKDVTGVARDALVTAFTTGNLFVVLPVLTEGAKRLFEEHDMKKENTDAYVDVIIPVSFNFPNIGKLIMLFFILFAGWFSGNEMALSAYPQFVFSGLMSFFGGVDVALPFMLDLMRIPSDMYQFYVVTGIVNGRTATMLAAMNLLAFTLLVVSSLTGYLKVDWRKIGLLVAGSAALLIGSMLIARVYFETAVDNAYNKDEVIATMHLMEEKGESAVFDVVPGPDQLPPDPDINLPLLNRIQARGEIRIGFTPALMPFSYVNDEAQLVGFDIEMMYRLAKDLGVRPVFMPALIDAVPGMLSAGIIDVAVGSIPVTMTGLQAMRFSAPYMDITLGFLVRDYNRNQFTDLQQMRETPGLAIAVGASKILDYYFNIMVRGFPEASIVRIDSVETFLNDDSDFYDALLVGAEQGSALTLLNPSYSVVVPRPGTISVPLAYGVAEGQRDFADFLSSWIDLKKKENVFERYYQHWVLGETEESEKEPRWSVIHNVLGWR